jgi:hypothetical protein
MTEPHPLDIPEFLKLSPRTTRGRVEAPAP